MLISYFMLTFDICSASFVILYQKDKLRHELLCMHDDQIINAEACSREQNTVFSYSFFGNEYRWTDLFQLFLSIIHYNVFASFEVISELFSDSNKFLFQFY